MGSINRALVSCACGASPNYAKTQFKIKHPDDPVPEMYIAKKGYNLLETLPPNSEVRTFLSSVLKKKGRYSYLLEWDDEGTLTYVWNYQKNQRVQ